MRELLCGTQSSKEQLRRSRTESSAAPPAIEELAGEARQVRPARAACGSVSTDLGLLTGGEVRRASGPPAPASNILLRQVRYPVIILFAHHRSRKFPSGHDICREQTFYNNHAFLQVQTLPMPSASAMLSRGPKRNQYIPQYPGFLTGLSAVSAFHRDHAFSRAQAQPVYPTVPRLSHGLKRGQRRERM